MKGNEQLVTLNKLFNTDALYHVLNRRRHKYSTSAQAQVRPPNEIGPFLLKKLSQQTDLRLCSQHVIA